MYLALAFLIITLALIHRWYKPAVGDASSNDDTLFTTACYLKNNSRDLAVAIAYIVANEDRFGRQGLDHLMHNPYLSDGTRKQLLDMVLK